MAVGYNGTSAGTGNAVNQVTFAHDVGQGINRLLLVGVSNVTGTSVTSATYAGATMQIIRTNTNGAVLTLLLLTNPAINSNNVIVNYSGAVSSEIGAVSFTGVNLSNPIEAIGDTTGNSTTITQNLTTISPSALVVDFGASASAFAWTVDASQSSKQNVNGTAADLMISTESGAVAPGSVTMSWTIGFATTWGQIVVALNPFKDPLRTNSLRPAIFSPGLAR